MQIQAICQKEMHRKDNCMTFPLENYTIIKEEFIVIMDINVEKTRQTILRGR